MTDNMLMSLSFLFTLEHVHIRMKELFSASFVHLVLFIAKNGKKLRGRKREFNEV